MRNQKTGGLSNRVLALIVFCVFILLAIVGPVFFSQPDRLAVQITVSVLAFGTFMILGGLQLGSKIRIRTWGIILVFVLGYVALFLLRDGDFRPDQHWFVMSPLGWVAGALAFGKPDREQPTKPRQVTSEGLTVQCWSSTGRIETPPKSPEKLVEQLDGNTLTLVQLVKDTKCLEVAGGPHDRVVVYYSDNRHDDGSWFVYTRVNATSRTDTEEQLMFIGDVEGYIPERFWASPAQAQTLVAEFIKNGCIDTSRDHHWTNTGPMAGGTRPSLPTER